MRPMKDKPCFKCEERYIGCHGKNEDGTWKCERYGRSVERQHEEKAAYLASPEGIMAGYEQSNRNRIYRKMDKLHYESGINARRYR